MTATKMYVARTSDGPVYCDDHFVVGWHVRESGNGRQFHHGQCYSALRFRDSHGSDTRLALIGITAKSRLLKRYTEDQVVQCRALLSEAIQTGKFVWRAKRIWIANEDGTWPEVGQEGTSK